MAEVNVKIKAQNQTRTGFQQALGDAQRFGTSASGSLKSAFAGVASDIKSSIGGALAGLASIGALKNIIDQFGKLQDLSEQFGVSSESLQRFGQLASESGSSVDQLAAVFARLTINVQKAQSGTGEQAEALQALGISAKSLQNASPDQVFLALADALSKATNRNEAFANATALGGKQMRGLMPLLLQGADAIKAQADAVSVASDTIVAKVDAIGDRFGRLGQEITVAVAPAIAFIGEAFLAQIAIVKSFIETFLSAVASAGEATREALSGNFSGAGDIFKAEADKVSKAFDDAKNKINAIGSAPSEKKGKGALAEIDAAEEAASASTASKAAGVEQQIRDQITANARANMADEERLLSLKREKLALETKWGGMSRDNELKRLQLVGQIDQLEKQIADKKTERGPEFGPGTAEAAAGGFRVDAAAFQQQQAEEAARAIMAQQQNAFQGSQGASAFQRIGFASNEFFDTRQPKSDPAEETKRAAKLVGEILQVLKKGEPLVLNPTNS